MEENYQSKKQLKPRQTYLKGKSVFIVSLVVIVVTVLTVYLTGENYNRTLTSNFYLSLSIIGAALLLFMTYGLYRGVGLADNFPKFKKFKKGDFFSHSGTIPDLPHIEVGDGIGGVLVSFVIWLLMGILFFVMLILLEAVFWISLFIILAMLYWVFFRALKFVFSKSIHTKGDLLLSAGYALVYSILYIGWMFGIVYVSTQWN